MRPDSETGSTATDCWLRSAGRSRSFVQAAGFNQQPSTPTGEMHRRPIRAFLEENVRVPFPPHMVVGSQTL